MNLSLIIIGDRDRRLGHRDSQSSGLASYIIIFNSSQYSVIKNSFSSHFYNIFI